MRDTFDDLSLEMIESMMNINCTSHIAVIKAGLPHMMTRKGGQIVNVLSLSGLFGMPVRTMYSASKFGLSGFGKAIRAEVAEFNIHVCNVYPDYV
jgi:short-subunit dehydrogenase